MSMRNKITQRGAKFPGNFPRKRWSILIAILLYCDSFSVMSALITQVTSALLLLPTFSSVLAAEVPNQLAASESAQHWKLLFDGKSTSGWRSFKRQTFPAKGWAVEDGWLAGLGQHGGDIISTGEFAQFDLQWEWKIAPGGNSGLKYFVLETRNSAIGHEYQMVDDAANPDGKTPSGKHITASFYDVLKPGVTPPLKPAGEINHSRVVVKGEHVEHWLNGVKVLEYECGSEPVKAAVAESKFKNMPGFGSPAKGHILLQDHGSRVWFRNIKIRDLSGE